MHFLQHFWYHSFHRTYWSFIWVCTTDINQWNHLFANQSEARMKTFLSGLLTESSSANPKIAKRAEFLVSYIFDTHVNNLRIRTNFYLNSCSLMTTCSVSDRENFESDRQTCDGLATVRWTQFQTIASYAGFDWLIKEKDLNFVQDVNCSRTSFDFIEVQNHINMFQSYRHLLDLMIRQ